MFNKMRPFLCCSQIPLEERIRGFYSTVGASVLWGAGCWAPSLRVQQLVSVQENRWLRCVLEGRKELDMEWVAWLRKAKRAAYSFRCRMKLPALWHRALAAIHGMGWALGAQQRAPPWCNSGLLAQCIVVGTHESCRCHQLRSILEAPEEHFGAWRRERFGQNMWRWVEGLGERRSPTLDGPKASFCG